MPKITVYVVSHNYGHFLADAIESAVLEFGGPEPSDDIAVLVLRVT